jgi:hypothetical protein
MEKIKILYISDRDARADHIMPGEWTSMLREYIQKFQSAWYTGRHIIKLTLDQSILTDMEKTAHILIKSKEYIENSLAKEE